MKRITTLAVVAAVGVAAVPTAAQAQQGSDPTAKATFIGKIKRVDKGNAAKIKVRYQCSEGSVLWVSAKQSKSRKKDKALRKEGSSQVAVAWLQTHTPNIKCDGKKHKQTFTIDKKEQGKGRLKKGKAYVQFCVTVPGTTPQDEGKLTLSKSGFVGVK